MNLKQLIELAGQCTLQSIRSGDNELLWHLRHDSTSVAVYGFMRHDIGDEVAALVLADELFEKLTLPDHPVL